MNSDFIKKTYEFTSPGGSKFNIVIQNLGQLLINDEEYLVIYPHPYTANQYGFRCIKTFTTHWSGANFDPLISKACIEFAYAKLQEYKKLKNFY